MTGLCGHSPTSTEVWDAWIFVPTPIYTLRTEQLNWGGSGAENSQCRWPRNSIEIQMCYQDFEFLCSLNSSARDGQKVPSIWYDLENVWKIVIEL